MRRNFTEQLNNCFICNNPFDQKPLIEEDDERSGSPLCDFKKGFSLFCKILKLKDHNCDSDLLTKFAESYENAEIEKEVDLVMGARGKSGVFESPCCSLCFDTLVTILGLQKAIEESQATQLEHVKSLKGALKLSSGSTNDISYTEKNFWVTIRRQLIACSTAGSALSDRAKDNDDTNVFPWEDSDNDEYPISTQTSSICASISASKDSLDKSIVIVPAQKVIKSLSFKDCGKPSRKRKLRLDNNGQENERSSFKFKVANSTVKPCSSVHLEKIDLTKTHIDEVRVNLSSHCKFRKGAVGATGSKYLDTFKAKNYSSLQRQGQQQRKSVCYKEPRSRGSLVPLRVTSADWIKTEDEGDENEGTSTSTLESLHKFGERPSKRKTGAIVEENIMEVKMAKKEDENVSGKGDDDAFEPFNEPLSVENDDSDHCVVQKNLKKKPKIKNATRSAHKSKTSFTLKTKTVMRRSRCNEFHTVGKGHLLFQHTFIRYSPLGFQCLEGGSCFHTVSGTDYYSLQEIRYHILDDHIHDGREYPGIPRTCIVCKQEQPNGIQLRRHLVSKHTELMKLICESCWKPFPPVGVGWKHSLPAFKSHTSSHKCIEERDVDKIVENFKKQHGTKEYNKKMQVLRKRLRASGRKLTPRRMLAVKLLKSWDIIMKDELLDTISKDAEVYFPEEDGDPDFEQITPPGAKRSSKLKKVPKRKKRLGNVTEKDLKDDDASRKGDEDDDEFEPFDKPLSAEADDSNYCEMKKNRKINPKITNVAVKPSIDKTGWRRSRCNEFHTVGKKHLLFQHTFIRFSPFGFQCLEGGNCFHKVSGTDYNSFQELRYHILDDHGGVEYSRISRTCIICKHEHPKGTLLRRHLISKHREFMKLICESCWKPFPVRCSKYTSELRFHMRTHKSKEEKAADKEVDGLYKKHGIHEYKRRIKYLRKNLQNAGIKLTHKRLLAVRLLKKQEMFENDCEDVSEKEAIEVDFPEDYEDSDFEGITSEPNGVEETEDERNPGDLSLFKNCQRLVKKRKLKATQNLMANEVVRCKRVIKKERVKFSKNFNKRKSPPRKRRKTGIAMETEINPPPPKDCGSEQRNSLQEISRSEGEDNIESDTEDISMTAKKNDDGEFELPSKASTDEEDDNDGKSGKSEDEIASDNVRGKLSRCDGFHIVGQDHLLFQHTFIKYSSHGFQCLEGTCSKEVGGTDFNAFQEIRFHIMVAHFDSQYSKSPKSCVICQKEFPNGTLLRRHLTSKSECHKYKQICECCWKPFPAVRTKSYSLRIFKDHTLTHKSEEDIAADNVVKEQKRLLGLKKYNKRLISEKAVMEGGEVRENSGTCKSSFEKKGSKIYALKDDFFVYLFSLFKISYGEILCQERDCDMKVGSFEFDAIPQMKTHIKLCHQDKNASRSCKICGEELKDGIQFRRHQTRTHSVSPSTFLCEICLKPVKIGDPRYSQFHTIHTMSHLNSAELMVALMGRKTKWGSFLEKIQAAKMGQEEEFTEGGFKCEVCDKDFSHEYHLKSHLVTHQPASMRKKFECSYCHVKLLSQVALQSHIERLHRPELQKKFRDCPVCNKRFHYRDGEVFRIHMRRHSNETPFVCELCGKGFFSKAGVKNHIETHEEANDFQCEFCEKNYKRLRNLVVHKRIAHKDMS